MNRHFHPIDSAAAALAEPSATREIAMFDQDETIDVDENVGRTPERSGGLVPTRVTTSGSRDVPNELAEIKARLADSEKLEWLVYEIFYANPIAFARKNLVIALRRHLLGEPLATPEEEQLRHLDTLSDEDRAAWHRANNAEKLKQRGVT